MKNILVTGGAGFIGSHLVDRLLAENIWRVTVIDDFNDFYSPETKRRNLAAHFDNLLFTAIEADIRRPDALDKIFERQKFDVIVHLAARAGVRPSLEQPVLYAETNINGTLNLLEAARKFGIKKFVFGSSSSVYGVNCKLPFGENDLVQTPISPYAATKIAGEALCHTYAHLYDIQTVCLRFFTVYGARQRPDLAIHKFANQIWREQPIQIFGDGTTRRDYTFIGDIINGVRAAIDYQETTFEIFNLGESETVELNELVNLLEQNLERRAVIEKCSMQPGDVPATFADIGKARRLLGYNPTTKINDGLKHFAKWFCDNNRAR